VRDRGVRNALPALTGARFSVNLALRFVYPFLPAIARGLGVSLGAAGVSMSIRELAGVAGPLVGTVIDRGRRLAGMLIGLVGVAAGCLAGGASVGLGVFTVAMVAVALFQMTYNAAMTAWVADRVPYERRGTALGLTELSWAGALLIGVPVLGLVIDGWGWRAPFLAVAGLNVVLAVLLPRFVAPDAPHVPSEERRRPALHRPAIALYGALGLMSLGVQTVFVVYGAWFEDAFGFGVAAVGLASILAGLSELTGSGATVFLTDRLGKLRSVLIGAAVMIPGCALLGTVGDRSVYGLALLAVLLLGFEFAFVSAQPLVSELSPDSRAATIGVSYAVITVGRAVGNLVGTLTYTQTGIGAVGLAAVAAIAMAMGLVAVFVREPD
jgi:predicted MFS family arabinose efflux permease